jgi:hypothetical protein
LQAAHHQRLQRDHDRLLAGAYSRPAQHNPYLGIIFFLLRSSLFIAGLLLIPTGVFLRRRKLQKAGQIPAEFPEVDHRGSIDRKEKCTP